MTIDQSKISFDEAVLLIRRAILLKGADYVYDSLNGGCYNFEDAATGNRYLGAADFPPKMIAPSCIVGHVLFWSPKTPEDVFTSGVGTIGYVSRRNGDFVTDKALRFLEVVQALQDSGTDWGDALKTGLGSMAPGGAVDDLYGFTEDEIEIGKEGD